MTKILPSLVTRAGLRDIHERKSLMLDRCFDGFLEISELGILSMHCMTTSCLFREFDCIDGSYEIAERSRLGLGTDWSCRRGLSGRQSIVFIIEHDIGDIHISTTRVDEVSHPDTITITITSDSDDRERWIDHLYPRGKWQCTTMKRLSSISIDILRGFP